MALKVEAGSKWVFIGDSITDAGRAQPGGEGLFNALGSGYVSYVDALIGAIYPEKKIRIVNMGTSGNTVRDLKKRWKTDVIEQKPDWLSVMIGINDVWRQFDTPYQAENLVQPDEYEATLEELILSVKGSVKGLILATPYYIESSKTDRMRIRMDEYGAIVKRCAASHDAIFIDTQAAFDRVTDVVYAAHLAWDRVHPTNVGVAILAKSFLDSVGFAWHA